MKEPLRWVSVIQNSTEWAHRQKKRGEDLMGLRESLTPPSQTSWFHLEFPFSTVDRLPLLKPYFFISLSNKTHQKDLKTAFLLWAVKKEEQQNISHIIGLPGEPI